jgi:hypothetical protein
LDDVKTLTSSWRKKEREYRANPGRRGTTRPAKNAKEYTLLQASESEELVESKMTIVYALVSRQKTVLAEFTQTSGKTKRNKEKS